MTKLFVFGGSGLVGGTLIKKISNEFDIVATYKERKIETKNCKSVELNLTNNKDILWTLLVKERPDIVINTIAYSNVDFCETNKEDAYFLHVECTEEIAKICEKIGAKLIYISTDWVFDDSKKLFSETDTPNPMNYYGITRLKAEEAVLKSSEHNVVIRPAVIYGWHPNSKFLNFVLENLKSGKQVFAYTDQYSTPTLVDDLVDCIIKIIKSDTAGIYHIVGSSCINRYEFAKILARKFDLSEKLVIPTTIRERPQIAKRPTISCLNNSKASKEFEMHYSTVEEGLNRVLQQSIDSN